MKRIITSRIAIYCRNSMFIIQYWSGSISDELDESYADGQNGL